MGTFSPGIMEGAAGKLHEPQEKTPAGQAGSGGQADTGRLGSQPLVTEPKIYTTI